MDNLAAKYRPKTLEDVVEQSVVIDIVKNICKSGEITNRNFLFIGPAGTGKALAHGEPVLTESGFKKIEEIKVGDRVITHTGAIACVSGVFPQGSRPIYEIELADGAKIRVSDNHLNIVSHCCEGRIKREVVTTDYLLSHNYESFSIPVADIKDHLVRLNLEDPRRLSVHRNIVCIRGLGMQECTCIYVNHPDHSFITRDFIPTHNTTTCRCIARELNDGNVDNVIELDAASHGGVNDVRELIDQMRAFPVGSKYKTFILDECFPSDSLVHTTSGLVKIKDIIPGTRIYNLTGEATVSHVFENSVKVENLICLHINNRKVVTTHDHLFFTDDGWVPAINLRKGDILYDYKTLQGMRNRIQSSVLQRCKGVLQQRMQKNWATSNKSINGGKSSRKYIESVSGMYEQILDSRIEGCSNMQRRLWEHLQREISAFSQVERAAIKNLAFIYMSQMRKEDGNKAERSEGSLWIELCKSDDGREETSRGIEEYCNKILRELRKRISSTLGRSLQKNMQPSLQSSSNSLEMFDTSSRDLSSNVRTDEKTQSRIQSRTSKEDGRNEEEEWNIDPEACYALWQRTFLQASDSFEERIGDGVGIRICCEDGSEQETQSKPLSYKLQTRPSITKIAARDRGGWDRPQYEISAVARRKESEMFRGARVDNIESYQRGNNDKLFQDYFPNTALCDAEYVTMYDLEIEGHPSFFVEDILVHNCHSFSSSAWQALLKTLEEQPARTISMLCTTNPEKIPATILSRVQTFQLSKISLDGIFNRLKYIIEQENKEGRHIVCEDDALYYIAKLAQGGLRDSITNLDQCLAYSTNITVENVMKALNLPDHDQYFELLNAIAKKNNEKIIEIINSVYNSGVNFVKWFDGFFSFVTNIVKFIYLQDINQTMIPSIYQDKISGYGTAHSALCLKLANKLVKMNQELKTTQYLQELAISYLCTLPTTQKG